MSMSSAVPDTLQLSGSKEVRTSTLAPGQLLPSGFRFRLVADPHSKTLKLVPPGGSVEQGFIPLSLDVLRYGISEGPAQVKVEGQWTTITWTAPGLEPTSLKLMTAQLLSFVEALQHSRKRAPPPDDSDWLFRFGGTGTL